MRVLLSICKNQLDNNSMQKRFLLLYLIAAFIVAGFLFGYTRRITSTSAIPSGWLSYYYSTLDLTIWHPPGAHVFIDSSTQSVFFEMGYPGQDVTLTVEKQPPSFQPIKDDKLRSLDLGCETYSTTTLLIGDHQFFSETCIWMGFRTQTLARTVEFTEFPDGGVAITTVIDPYTASSTVQFSTILNQMLSSVNFGG